MARAVDPHPVAVQLTGSGAPTDVSRSIDDKNHAHSSSCMCRHHMLQALCNWDAILQNLDLRVQ